MTRLWLVLAVACGNGARVEPAATPGSASPPVAAAIPDAAPEAVPTEPAPPDAAPAPATLADVLAVLRARGLVGAADAIARREAQREAKWKLSPAEALAAAHAVLAVAERPAFQLLHGVMPRSTVELARAVRERGVPLAEADAIAAYLVRFVAVLDFARLEVFDENHAHVTGREWHEIDYTGEGMTWQSQRAYWAPRGVASFKTRASIHAYFVGAERLPHWQKVYKPRGRIADLPP